MTTQFPIKLFVAGLELTLACPCRCQTCGSKAGNPRPDELSTEEWFTVIRDLAHLGCRRIALLGGEPLLRNDWYVLARHAVSLGMRVEMITSGIGLDDTTAALIDDIGLVSVTVSVDGIQRIHDKQRKVKGAFNQALQAIQRLDQARVRVGATTQINSETLPNLEELATVLEKAGVTGWQLQLTMPCGRAVERPNLTIGPNAMPEVYQTIRRLINRRGLRPYITDNIGYLTADDPVLRTPPGAAARCWMGCFAGLRAIGIMSDGSVKGCLALPDSQTEGSVRKEELQTIWEDPKRFAYNRAFNRKNLSGECATCTYGPLCRGGCTATALAFHNKPGISTHCLRLHGVK